MKPFPVSNIASAERLKRDGNQVLWVVTLGPGDKVTVRTHAMCNEKTAVKVALRQREALRESFKTGHLLADATRRTA